MRLWWGTLISAAFHAVLFCIPVSFGLTRMPPCEELQFIIIQEAPSWQAVPPAAPTTAARLPESPIIAPDPEPQPQKPTITMKTKGSEPLRVKKTPKLPEASVDTTPVSVGTAVEEEILPPPAVVDSAAAESTTVAASGGSVSGYTAPAGIPGESGSTSGPVAFGSGEGPKFLRRALPHYPRHARDMGREGTVVLSIGIDEKGNLMNVEVVQRAGYGFDEEAIRAVRDSSFKPAVRSGRPTACQANLPVRFVLRSSEDD